MTIPKPPEGKPAIAIYDIELSPIRMWCYSRWQANALWVDQEQYLMSFAFKWYGTSKIHYYDLRDQTTYSVDRKHDKQLTKALYDMWQMSDILVAYNGAKFDQRVAKMQFARHGLIPKPVRDIDPLKIARKEFKFSSNSMRQVAIELGVAPKLDVPLGHLTQQIIEHDDKQAWKEFKKYNIQDVETLEAIWIKIRPYATTHVTISAYGDYDGCPRCGKSDALIRYGFKYTNSYKYQEWHCNPKKGGCGHYPRTRVSEQSLGSDVKTKFV